MKALCVTFCFFCLARGAQAEETLLRGPHPFHKENLLSLHGGYAEGFSDAPRGPRLQGDFHYRLGPSLWLDLQLGFLAGSCEESADCGKDSGKIADTLVGVAWNFQTSVPLIPYLRIAGGPVFLFPAAGNPTAGFLLRGAIGVHYFFFDWFGVGLEASLAYGEAFTSLSPLQTQNLSLIELSAGPIWHF